jgi:hypothetical protein
MTTHFSADLETLSCLAKIALCFSFSTSRRRGCMCTVDSGCLQIGSVFLFGVSYVVDVVKVMIKLN